MVGVKKLVVHKSQVLEHIQSILAEGKYNSIKVFFKGSKKHEKEHIHPDYVLIIAYRSKR